MTKEELLNEIVYMREQLHGYEIHAMEDEKGAKAKKSEIEKFYYLGKRTAYSDAISLLDDIVYKEEETNEK